MNTLAHRFVLALAFLLICAIAACFWAWDGARWCVRQLERHPFGLLLPTWMFLGLALVLGVGVGLAFVS